MRTFRKKDFISEVEMEWIHRKPRRILFLVNAIKVQKSDP